MDVGVISYVHSTASSIRKIDASLLSGKSRTEETRPAASIVNDFSITK